jgi:hypothetical protein
MRYHFVPQRHPGIGSGLMAKVSYILLLPLSYNDKTTVPKKVKYRIFDDLFRLAGGYHIAGTGKGAYRMKRGQKKVDRSLEVWVVIDEQDEDTLKELVGGFATLLGQEAVYLEKAGGTVEYVPPQQKGGRR